VAIVQISQITQRKGYSEDLPQLAGAEFGWCLDTRQLFIGNGTLQEGAPVIGNTEILTEFSDIAVLTNYTYKDIAVGYAAQTGQSPSSPVVRTLQAVLDDYASVRDFGAVGDGVTDDTAAINRALFELYCRETNTQIRRSLFFPAGTYRTTETIVIPTYAKLIGEGADCSIIYLDQGDILNYTYVAQYGDSLQQSGVNIGTNGATPPQHIEISSMTFQSADPIDIFLVDRASQCWFDSVYFVGNSTLTEVENSGLTPLPSNAAVRFDSDGALVCKDITFDKCGFTNIKYAINTTESIYGITVSNSVFDTLYQGIVLDVNPSNFRALHNVFDNIYAEAISYGNINLNVSAYNAFNNVGFGISNTGPITPVIVFNNDNNVSVHDLFTRSDADAYTIPRIEIIPAGQSTSGGTQLQMGMYTRDTGKTFTLTNNVVNQTVLSINDLYVKAFQMQYSIQRDSSVRYGILTVTSNGGNYNDDYTENLSTGITLSAAQNGNQLSVLFTSTNTGIDGTLTYSISHLA
jgi:hypothetical protein